MNDFKDQEDAFKTADELIVQNQQDFNWTFSEFPLKVNADNPMLSKSYYMTGGSVQRTIQINDRRHLSRETNLKSQNDMNLALCDVGLQKQTAPMVKEEYPGWKQVQQSKDVLKSLF